MLRATLLAAVAAVLMATPARAVDSACETADINGDDHVNSDDRDLWAGIVYKQVVWYGPLTTSTSDLRADSSGLVRLRGWLYYRTGRTISNARVIIYNHGHDKGRNEPCAIASFFVKRGFVVFAPLRRGHEANTPDDPPGNWNKIASTGMHTDDYVAYCRATDCLDHVRCGIVPLCSEDLLEVDYMRSQVQDVIDEMAYVKSLPAVAGPGKLADPRQIALLGHSFGGSLVLMANAGSAVHGHAVAVSVSGAELSWDGNPYWEEYLRPAVADAARPIYFLQPKNGRSLGPTRELSRVALDNGYRFQAAVFAKAPWDPDKPAEEWSQAHGTFINQSGQVESWGPSVIDFLRRNELPPPGN